MPEPLRQLPLGVRLRDEATLDNFYFFAEMAVLSTALLRTVAEGGEHFIYLHGATGSGRSHLLQGACQKADPGAALYLPLQELIDSSPRQIVEGIENLELVCLDNLDAVVGRPDWEQSLCHLCNRVLEKGTRLLFSADQSPRHLGVQLPDLQSRLSWGLVVQLPEASDAEKLSILRFRAERRGLELSTAVGGYIMTRAGRSLVELMAILDRLDRASLAHQRQLSVPFVKSALGW